MSSDRRNRVLRPATRAVHEAVPRSQFGELAEAMYMTSSFTYPTMEASEARFDGSDPGFVYTRFGNPTTAMFEKRLAALEGAEVCRATATGMAAVTAGLLSLLKAGDRIVASVRLFGSCRWLLEELLPRYGIEVVFVSGPDIAEWERAATPGTKALFFETPTNPTIELIDIDAVVAIARGIGAKVVVDNAMASPVVQTPTKHGVDVVIYSATKHIDGQGRTLGGAILSSQAYHDEFLQQFLRHTGPAMSPFNAWVLGKSLETIGLRVERMAATAARLADVMAQQNKVLGVRYPTRADHPHHDVARRQMLNGGTVVSVEIEGGKAGAFRFANALEVIRISNNFADAKSIVTHPATTTHQRFTTEARAEMGIHDGTLRMSFGLEDPEDLVEDVLVALEAV